MTDRTSGSQAQRDFFDGKNGELVYTSRDDDTVSYFVYPVGYFKDDVVPENTAKFLTEHPNYRCYIYAANAFGISKVRVYEFGSVRHEREYYFLLILDEEMSDLLTYGEFDTVVQAMTGPVNTAANACGTSLAGMISAGGGLVVRLDDPSLNACLVTELTGVEHIVSAEEDMRMAVRD